MPFIAPQTITDSQLMWLQAQIGWRTIAAGAEQRTVARARCFDEEALTWCAWVYNARRLNEQLDAALDWRPMPAWLPGRAGWLVASVALSSVPPTSIGERIVRADPSLTYHVATGLMLQVGPREVPSTPAPASIERCPGPTQLLDMPPGSARDELNAVIKRRP